VFAKGLEPKGQVSTRPEEGARITSLLSIKGRENRRGRTDAGLLRVTDEENQN
jgi:hypothetical protein